VNADAPQVSWKSIDEDAAVVSGDGLELGRVKEIVGDEEADIFNGVVLSPTKDGGSRYVPAERVTRISPDRVETDLSADEAATLAAYAEPVSVTWRAGDQGGLGSRLRSAIRDLFGRNR
jgi:hypothetical protein